MKAIKIIVVLLLVSVFSSSCSGQVLNNLSLDQYYNKILIDGVSIGKIIDENKKEGNIDKLFSSTVDFKQESAPIDEYFFYEVDGSKFHFEMNEPNNRKNSQITAVEIGGNALVKILDDEVKIGSNVSNLLQKYKIRENGVIVFSQDETSSTLQVYYSNSIITKMEIDFF